MGEKMSKTPPPLFDNIFLKGPEDVMPLKRNAEPLATAELFCLTPYLLDEWEECSDKESEAAY
jgi:hypothetical protein